MMASPVFSTRRVLVVIALTLAIAWALGLASNTTPHASDGWSVCAPPAAACTNASRP